MRTKYVVNTNYAKELENKLVKNSSETLMSVIVHKNGDTFNVGKRLVINPRQVRSWEYFLEYLRRSFGENCKAIRDIATPTCGTRIHDLNDLENQRRYVAIPAGEKLKHLDYLQIEENLRNPKPILSREVLYARLRKRHKKELALTEGRIKQEMGKRGKTIYVYRNGDEFTRAIHVYLTPIQMQEIEIVLRTIGERVVLQDNRAIRRLFAMDGQEMRDAEELQDGHSYVATGTENMHQCQYGHALPRLQVGTARKKADEQTIVAGIQIDENESFEEEKHVGVHYLNDLPDELNDKVCEQLSHHTPRFEKQKRALPPLNSARETESQRLLQCFRAQQILSLEEDNFEKIEKRGVKIVSEATQNAAIKIQASYRGFRVRRDRKRLNEAAKKIQAGFRGFNIRKNLSNSKNSQKVLMEITQQEDHKDIILSGSEQAQQAAIKIQAGYRGYRTRKALNQVQNKVTDEQIYTRAQTFKLDKPSYNRDENLAASKIQAGFRGYKTRKMYKQEKTRLNNAAIKIQANYRGYKSRKQNKYEPLISEKDSNDIERAATKIQATFRGYKARKELKIRPKIEQNKENWNKKRYEQAATRIQANYRGYKVRQNLKKSSKYEEIDLEDIDEPYGKESREGSFLLVEE